MPLACRERCSMSIATSSLRRSPVSTPTRRSARSRRPISVVVSRVSAISRIRSSVAADCLFRGVRACRRAWPRRTATVAGRSSSSAGYPARSWARRIAAIARRTDEGERRSSAPMYVESVSSEAASATRDASTGARRSHQARNARQSASYATRVAGAWLSATCSARRARARASSLSRVSRSMPGASGSPVGSSARSAARAPSASLDSVSEASPSTGDRTPLIVQRPW